MCRVPEHRRCFRVNGLSSPWRWAVGNVDLQRWGRRPRPWRCAAHVSQSERPPGAVRGGCPPLGVRTLLSSRARSWRGGEPAWWRSAPVQERWPNRRPAASAADPGCIGAEDSGERSGAKCCPNPRPPGSGATAGCAVGWDPDAGGCRVWARCPNGRPPSSETGVACATGGSGAGSGTSALRRLSTGSQPSAPLDGARTR